MTKKDYIEASLFCFALMVLGGCLLFVGALQGKQMMEKQAIANGAATYTQEGEFVWIKK